MPPGLVLRRIKPEVAVPWADRRRGAKDERYVVGLQAAW